MKPKYLVILSCQVSKTYGGWRAAFRDHFQSRLRMIPYKEKKTSKQKTKSVSKQFPKGFLDKVFVEK